MPDSCCKIVICCTQWSGSAGVEAKRNPTDRSGRWGCLFSSDVLRYAPIQGLTVSLKPHVQEVRIDQRVHWRVPPFPVVTDAVELLVAAEAVLVGRIVTQDDGLCQEVLSRTNPQFAESALTTAAHQ